MISTPTNEDFEAISQLISSCVNSCIAAEQNDLLKIQSSSIDASKNWLDEKIEGVHLIYKDSDEIVGLVLVEDFWNMISLFVAPKAQRSGIATLLVDNVLDICRIHSKKKMVALNSSDYASGFYKDYGFDQNGQSRDLPGGCIPFIYRF